MAFSFIYIEYTQVHKLFIGANHASTHTHTHTAAEVANTFGTCSAEKWWHF